MQSIQGQEGDAAAAGALEVVDGDRGVVPAFDDDILQRAAQRGLDGLVVFCGHVDQRGHRADDTVELFVLAGRIGWPASTVRTPLA